MVYEPTVRLSGFGRRLAVIGQFGNGSTHLKSQKTWRWVEQEIGWQRANLSRMSERGPNDIVTGPRPSILYSAIA
jgi:hypothetical protein